MSRRITRSERIDASASRGARYRALVGLNAADGTRVEAGEELPAGLFPEGLLVHWFLRGKVEEIDGDSA